MRSVHRRLSASGLDVARRCPASFALPAVDTGSSEFAQAGTGRHAFLDEFASHWNKCRDVQRARELALATVPADASWREACEGIDLDAQLVMPNGQPPSKILFGQGYALMPGEEPVVEALGGVFESLSRGGARLQQCLAATMETERLSAFQRHCGTECDKKAMSAAQIRGMSVFFDKAQCDRCHFGFNFTDGSYETLGIGMDKPNPDLGRFLVTKKPADKGAFKTPTLRSIADTAPYMHDGAFKTLEDVVSRAVAQEITRLQSSKK